MKRKSYFLAFAFSLIALSSLAQIDIDEPVNENNKSKTQGFFVKEGKQKIEELECYNFKDLILSFDLKKEHFACDRLCIELEVGNKIKNVSYKYYIDQDEFSALFEGKDYAYFKVFSSNDMKEKSEWVFKKTYMNSDYPPSYYNLTRSRLQHCRSKKNLNDSKIMVKISCGKITGENAVSEARSDGRVVTRKYNTWKWFDSSVFSIDLKNRVFINIAKFKVLGYPSKPVVNGDCYQ